MEAFSVLLFATIIAVTNAAPLKYKPRVFRSHGYTAGVALQGLKPGTVTAGYNDGSFGGYLPPASDVPSVPASTYGAPTQFRAISSNFRPLTQQVPVSFGFNRQAAMRSPSLPSAFYDVPSRVVKTLPSVESSWNSLSAPNQYYQADVISAIGSEFSRSPSGLPSDSYGVPIADTYGPPVADSQVDEEAKGYSYPVPSKQLVI